MPIYDALKNHAFAPDEIKLLVAAFEEAVQELQLEEALQELQLKDRSDPATILVAKRIIGLAQRGSATLSGCAKRA
jgi:hypothetical protein